MSDAVISALYVVGGLAIVCVSILGLARPEKYWGSNWSRSLNFTSEEGTRPLKRAASALALFGGLVLISKGIALI